jgi:TRAP-type C4-dicarboxylate transport system permease small subunit
MVKIESIIAAFSLFSILVLSLFQIIARNFFDFGYPEIDIINRNLLIVSGAMGAVVATSKLRHIKIDALGIFLNKRILKLLCCPLAIFSSVVCALLCYYAFTFVTDEWEYAPANERWALPFTLIYPVGFGLLSLHFLLNCVQKRQ